MMNLDDVGKVLSKVRARMDKVEKMAPVVVFLAELVKLEAKEKRIDNDFFQRIYIRIATVPPIGGIFVFFKLYMKCGHRG